MRPGLQLGAPHVLRYVVPLNQTVADLLPALAEFRRGQSRERLRTSATWPAQAPTTNSNPNNGKKVSTLNLA